MKDQTNSPYRQYLRYLQYSGMTKRDLSFQTWKNTCQYEAYFRR